MQKKILYMFLDEGGNLDFGLHGTRYFALTCLTTNRPFQINSILDDYKYELIEYGLPQEFFHCAEDNNHIRTQVFNIINRQLDDFQVDSLIIEKCSVSKDIREDKKFYPKMLGQLMRHVIYQYNKQELHEIIVITDRLPINKKRQAIEKSIKLTLASMLTTINIPYRIIHHTSKSHYGLQVVYYCNWAILRKWELQDTVCYNKIKFALKSELDRLNDLPNYPNN